MSPRDWFWFLAGASVTVAIMVAVRASLRQRPVQAVKPAIPAIAVPIAAALALIGVALGIYFVLGSPDSTASFNAAAAPQRRTPTQMEQPSAGSLDDVTQKLASRLAASGGSDSEWKLLAESYDYMGRVADAKAARAHIASAAHTGGVDSAGHISVAPMTSVTADQMAVVAAALDNHKDRSP